MQRIKKAEEQRDDETPSAVSPHGQDGDRIGDSRGNGGKDDDATEAPPASLEEQLAAARQEAEDYKDRYLRARADLENFRKRSVQYVAEGVRDGLKQTFEEILPVLDNLERAIAFQEQHQTESVEDVLTGVRMTLLQLRDVLERQNVTRQEVLGEPFDPRFHEAVDVQPADGDVEPDTIVGEIKAGYLFGDTVLRPAQVRVAQRSGADD